jgi:hypothetical protein
MPETTQVPPERPEEPVPLEETPGEERREQPPSEATRRAADILAKALSEAETLLLGAVQERPPLATVGAAVPAQRPPLEEVNELIRTLTEHFDRALDRLTEERRLLVDEVQSSSRALKDYFERAQDRMDDERRYLAEQVGTLSRADERLERRLEELAASLAELRSEAQAPGKAVERAPVEREPEFIPGEAPLTLIVSSVPGFQGLMEAQRALMRLPSIEGASVERYFDGEARIVLTLREPVGAAQLVETLSEATGQQAEVEESRPEALRLRVRFRGTAP